MKKVLGITFDAMDTSIKVQIIVNAEWREKFKSFLRSLPAWFTEVEATLSRFDPQSELSRINNGTEKTYHVSDRLADVVNLALNAAKVTDGIFDPTILKELEQAGYDRTFQEVMARMEIRSPETFGKEHVNVANRGYELVGIDRKTGSLKKLNGVGLDLGGIAKGWAVDQIFNRLRNLSGQAEICVNAGGDLRLVNPSGQKPWDIKVENPFDRSNHLLSLRINCGAVATSNVLKRRWKHQGKWQHHLIDPRTGFPSQSTVIAATVVANTTVEAEVWAKVICILGDTGLEHLHERTNFAALLVSCEGDLIINEKMRRFIDAGISKPTFSVCF